MCQLDVAIRADTTQRHLSFLEQGRSKPGRTMVLRLAESLDLTLRERGTGGSCPHRRMRSTERTLLRIVPAMRASDATYRR